MLGTLGDIRMGLGTGRDMGMGLGMLGTAGDIGMGLGTERDVGMWMWGT